MNIHTAIKRARATNKALREKDWPKDKFIYHGMDNLFRWPDEKGVTFSIASLFSTEWITTNLHPYQKPIKE